jgi:hypothetical protein
MHADGNGPYLIPPDPPSSIKPALPFESWFDGSLRRRGNKNSAPP